VVAKKLTWTAVPDHVFEHWICQDAQTFQLLFFLQRMAKRSSDGHMGVGDTFFNPHKYCETVTGMTPQDCLNKIKRLEKAKILKYRQAVDAHEDTTLLVTIRREHVWKKPGNVNNWPHEEKERRPPKPRDEPAVTPEASVAMQRAFAEAPDPVHDAQPGGDYRGDRSTSKEVVVGEVLTDTSQPFQPGDDELPEVPPMRPAEVGAIWTQMKDYGMDHKLWPDFNRLIREWGEERCLLVVKGMRRGCPPFNDPEQTVKITPADMRRFMRRAFVFAQLAPDADLPKLPPMPRFEEEPRHQLQPAPNGVIATNILDNPLTLEETRIFTSLTDEQRQEIQDRADVALNGEVSPTIVQAEIRSQFRKAYMTA
jgi:hypothetical protein